MAEEDTLTAPYGSWETAKNAIQGFAEGVPPRIDRTAFPGLAWNATSRLLGGLRFLGLINEAGTPLPALQSVAVSDETARKFAIGKLLRERYPAVFRLDLARVTPAHLAEVLGDSYNAKGDTREKAVRFFVSAATYAGIQLSPLLMRDKSRKASGSPTRRVSSTREPITERPSTPPSSGATRAVQLASGGTLTLTASVDFLSLSADDRTFVFELIDRLAAYERQHGDND